MFLKKVTSIRIINSGVVLAMMLFSATIMAQDENLSNTSDNNNEAATSEEQFNTNPTHRLIIPRKDQSEEQQWLDQAECYEWTCEQLDWDPYQAYDFLVDEGYAVALSKREMERGLVFLAAEGAMFGAVAGDIAGSPRGGAEIGAAIAIATGIIHSSYLLEPESPQTQQVITRYERELKKWEKQYAGCMKRKYYKVPSQ